MPVADMRRPTNTCRARGAAPVSWGPYHDSLNCPLPLEPLELDAVGLDGLVPEAAFALLW